LFAAQELGLVVLGSARRPYGIIEAMKKLNKRPLEESALRIQGVDGKPIDWSNVHVRLRDGKIIKLPPAVTLEWILSNGPMKQVREPTESSTAADPR
jgi:hypothetical protein